MTEAVIALPVLLLLFFAVYYFHGVYRATLSAHRQAEVHAWARVDAPDCREQMDSDAFVLPVVDGGSLPLPSGIAAVFVTGRWEASADRHATVPRILRNREGRVHSRRRVTLTCNEQTLENLPGMLTTLLGMSLEHVAGTSSLFW